MTQDNDILIDEFLKKTYVEYKVIQPFHPGQIPQAIQTDANDPKLQDALFPFSALYPEHVFFILCQQLVPKKSSINRVLHILWDRKLKSLCKPPKNPCFVFLNDVPSKNPEENSQDDIRVTTSSGIANRSEVFPNDNMDAQIILRNHINDISQQIFLPGYVGDFGRKQWNEKSNAKEVAIVVIIGPDSVLHNRLKDYYGLNPASSSLVEIKLILPEAKQKVINDVCENLNRKYKLGINDTQKAELILLMHDNNADMEEKKKQPEKTESNHLDEKGNNIDERLKEEDYQRNDDSRGR